MKKTSAPGERRNTAPTLDLRQHKTLELVDRTRSQLDRSLRLIGMIEAIGRLCWESESSTEPGDLASIFNGLSVVAEHLHEEITVADSGLGEVWHMVRGGESVETGGVQ